MGNFATPKPWFHFLFYFLLHFLQYQVSALWHLLFDLIRHLLLHLVVLSEFDHKFLTLSDLQSPYSFHAGWHDIKTPNALLLERCCFLEKKKRHYSPLQKHLRGVNFHESTLSLERNLKRFFDVLPYLLPREKYWDRK